MKKDENEKMKQYDRSPEISLEERLKHDQEAMRFNYEMAIDEIEHLMNRSKLQRQYVKANKERVWTDHKGRTWVCDYPIAEAERTFLNSALEVISNYEGRERGKAMDEIRDAREKGSERGKNRLSEFKAHEDEAKPNPSFVPQVQSRDRQEDIER